MQCLTDSQMLIVEKDVFSELSSNSFSTVVLNLGVQMHINAPNSILVIDIVHTDINEMNILRKNAQHVLDF